PGKLLNRPRLSERSIMAAALSLLALALAGAWLARLTAGGRRWRRGFVAVPPAARAWLRGLGLVEPEDFLGLDLVVVSGHPGRQVGRLTLGEGAGARVVYLKRETQVRWRTRLTNFLAGYGWVSGCAREAGVLEAL